ncbi:hypothetical protein MAHJHV55_51740 [Mycobacterium avium subsp. hominissuis]
MPGQMAHSLIPIVVGYIFAHYLSYLVERGQQAVFALADPFGRGWNPLHQIGQVVREDVAHHDRDQRMRHLAGRCPARWRIR